MPEATELPPAVPAGARVLHIGIPKTGTTAIQQAAARRRTELAAHGVCYPGRSFNHREQAAALMGRSQGWKGAGAYVPDQRLWRELVAELEQRPEHRGFVSHEFVAECDDDQARRFVDELGPELHVVITLRGFADLLGSTWQQYVKAGNTLGFEPWLRLALAEPPSPKLPRSFARRNDQAVIVGRWTRLLGPERVTVVIADKQRPDQLTDAFEALLALPQGMLVMPIESGFAANRTLSLTETELVRQLNRVVGKKRVGWGDYDALVRLGAIARVQEHRRPGPDEPGLRLPAWAAERASVVAAGYAAAVRASGCRVVGDPETLARPVAVRDADVPEVTEVPMDLAVQALAGLLSAATGQQAFFEADEPPLPAGLVAGVARTEVGRAGLKSYASSLRLPATGLAAALALRGAARMLRLGQQARARLGLSGPASPDGHPWSGGHRRASDPSGSGAGVGRRRARGAASSRR